MYDPDRYRDKAEIEQWKARDPITSLTAQLRQDGQLTDHDLEVFEKGIAAEIAQAIDTAEAAGIEPTEDLTKFVYSPRPS
jgi:pyruvate dehydrogenase E1 component alpha subunit